MRPPRNERIVSAEACDLHQAALVVDLHADTLLPMRLFGYDIGKRHRLALPRAAWFFHADLPRWADGGVAGQFFGLVTSPWPRGGRARVVFRNIARLEAACRRHPERLRLARTAADLLAARTTGHLAAFLGVEGAHALDGRLDTLHAFAQSGVRYLGLAHFSTNAAAPAAYGLRADNTAPLPPFGREVVAACEALGVLVDLAHVGRRAFLDAARMATRPLIVSHTGLQAVAANWRNIDDEQIRAVAERDGVIGVMFAPRFLAPDRRRDAGLVVDHLDHLRRTVGARHAALGSDFDGTIVPPQDLRSPADLPRLTERLLRRGWPPDDILAVLGGNVLRVLRALDDRPAPEPRP